MPTEPLPINDYLTDLEGQWTYSNVSGSSSKPSFIEVTGSNEKMRFDLNVNDQLVKIGDVYYKDNKINKLLYKK